MTDGGKEGVVENGERGRQETEPLRQQDRGQNQQHHDDKKLRGPCLILFLILLNLMLMCCNIWAICKVIQESQVNDVHVPSSMCVLCNQIRLHPEDKLENITRLSDNITCCVNKTEHIPALVSYYTEHWLKMKTATDNPRYCYKDYVDTAKPAIKLVGLPYHPEGHRHKLLWDGSSDLAINDNPHLIEYNEQHGHIIVKKAGLYWVYSQVSF